jgi:Uma2 family endonuclease
MGKSKQRATYDDLLELPDHVVGEIVNGELFVSPRPRVPHSLAHSGVLGHLWGAFNGPAGRGSGPGGWWIVTEPELRLGQDVVIPDVAGWRTDRITLRDDTVIEIPPDWLCEVISPSTERIDHSRKKPLYARVGVQHMWLVYPLGRTVEVLALDGGAWKIIATHAGDVRVRMPPFEAVEMDLARLWMPETEGDPQP